MATIPPIVDRVKSFLSRPPFAAGSSFREKYGRELAGDIALVWRQERLAGLWGALRHHALERLGGRLVLVVFEQSLAEIDESPPPAGVEISLFPDPASGRAATYEDWAALAPITTAYRRRLFCDRTARGRTCLVAWRDGEPLGYTWLSPLMERAIEHYEFPLPWDAAYGWDLNVVPRERRGGVGTALVRARMHHARSLGFRTIWRAITRTNRASLRTLRKTWGAESRLVGMAIHVTVLGDSRTRFVPISCGDGPIGWVTDGESLRSVPRNGS